MKSRKKKIILIIPLFLAVFFFVPLPFITDSQETSIQEKALYFLYNSEDYGKKSNVKVFYVETGKGCLFDSFIDFGENNSVLKIEDPSEQLLNTIKEWSPQIKPGSQYHPVDTNDIIVRNEQDEMGVFLRVGPIIKSTGLACCRTGYFGGGLCSAEYETFLIWTPFGWKHLFSLCLWES